MAWDGSSPTEPRPLGRLITGRLAKLALAAAETRLVQFDYTKRHETASSRRVVACYHLSRIDRNVYLHALQIDPAVEGDASRSFRLDRMSYIVTLPEHYTPRDTITMAQGDMIDYQTAKGRLNALVEPARTDLACGLTIQADAVLLLHPTVAHYLKTLDEHLGNGDKPPDLTVLRHVGSLLKAQQRRVVHACVYAQALLRLANAGQVSDLDEERLQNIRIILDQLGWSP